MKYHTFEQEACFGILNRLYDNGNLTFTKSEISLMIYKCRKSPRYASDLLDAFHRISQFKVGKI